MVERSRLIFRHRLTHTDRVLHKYHRLSSFLKHPLGFRNIPSKLAGFHLPSPPPSSLLLPPETLLDRPLIDLVERVRVVVRKEIRG